MKNFTLLVFMLSMFITSSQNYDFGKVSKEELQEKINPSDSSASATYLYKYRKTFFKYNQNEGFSLITEIHDRIKIYTNKGFDYATKEVSLYKSSSDKEKISNIKAYTYNLVDGKILVSKLKKDAIFQTEESRDYNQTKFTMPNIKVGTVIEYKYNIISPFFSNVDEFIFQHDIPIKKLEAKFEVPEFFNFKVDTKGYLAVNPVIESKRDIITFNDKSRSFVGGFSRTKTTFSSSNLGYSKNIYTYSLANISALKEEPYVNNMNNYRSSVKYELSYTKFPNSIIKYYTTTWENVIKTIYKDPSFGGELNKSGYFKDDINALVETISDPLKKTALIFNFVKSKVNWNGYFGKYTNDGVKKTYKNQSGNVAEINLMLTSMLRHAGLNANPVLVSTRSHGIPLFPTREGYNYVICSVEINNNVILLDATSKYSTPNVLPLRTLNWQGRIIREQGSSTLINLYPDKKSQNTISLSVNLNDNGDIEGKIRSIKTNHQALVYRESYIGTDKDQFLEDLENKFGGMEINDFEVRNDSDLSKPITETYEFSLESQADVIGGKMYISPLFFLSTKENPFKLENREFPVDFGYPTKSNYRIKIKLPEGYKVETKPEPIAFVLPNNLGAFKYNILANEKFIQLIISSEINQSIIPPSYYKALKEYFNKLLEKEKEKIVLTKS